MSDKIRVGDLFEFDNGTLKEMWLVIEDECDLRDSLNGVEYDLVTFAYYSKTASHIDCYAVSQVKQYLDKGWLKRLSK